MAEQVIIELCKILNMQYAPKVFTPEQMQELYNQASVNAAIVESLPTHRQHLGDQEGS